MSTAIESTSFSHSMSGSSHYAVLMVLTYTVQRTSPLLSMIIMYNVAAPLGPQTNCRQGNFNRWKPYYIHVNGGWGTGLVRWLQSQLSQFPFLAPYTVLTVRPDKPFTSAICTLSLHTPSLSSIGNQGEHCQRNAVGLPPLISFSHPGSTPTTRPPTPNT